jgi:O-antigen ligase
VTVIFQSCIGLYQFINQKSLSGYLLLGEPQLVQTLGLAREVVWGAERVLPYGTTAHPNILGGILAAYLIVLISQLHHFTQRKWWQKGIYFAAIVLGGVTIWTTHSLSAWAAALLGIGLASYSLWRGSKPPTIPLALAILIGITISLVTPILLAQYANVPSSIASSSIERRVILQEAAINMLTAKPLTGVGLNHFTMVLEDTMPSRETIRFIQPVHSVLLLWMAETGGVGLLLLLLLTLLAWQKRLSVPISIVAILPLAVVDHYLLTLQSGLLLTVIFVMYVQRSETSDT